MAKAICALRPSGGGSSVASAVSAGTGSAVATLEPRPVARAMANEFPDHRLRVGLVVGSLRFHSYSQSIADGLAELLREQAGDLLLVEQLSIAELPIYNQDFDDLGPPPPSYPKFREQVRGLSAVVFVTPEYNRSLPAVLKNALDVGSRPAGQNVWAKKPCGVVSSSPGPIGGFGASQNLKQVLGYLDLRIMQQPEMYLGKIADSIDANGQLSEHTRSFLSRFTTAFIQWITLGE